MGLNYTGKHSGFEPQNKDGTLTQYNDSLRQNWALLSILPVSVVVGRIVPFMRIGRDEFFCVVQNIDVFAIFTAILPEILSLSGIILICIRIEGIRLHSLIGIPSDSTLNQVLHVLVPVYLILPLFIFVGWYTLILYGIFVLFSVLSYLLSKFKHRRRVVSWKSIFVPLTMLFVLLQMASGPHMWLPKNEIFLDSGQSIHAYVLSETSEWATLLTENPRKIQYINVSTITERHIYVEYDSNTPILKYLTHNLLPAASS